jgi:hypothetical protein
LGTTESVPRIRRFVISIESRPHVVGQLADPKQLVAKRCHGRLPSEPPMMRAAVEAQPSRNTALYTGVSLGFERRIAA